MPPSRHSDRNNEDSLRFAAAILVSLLLLAGFIFLIHQG